MGVTILDYATVLGIGVHEFVSIGNKPVIGTQAMFANGQGPAIEWHRLIELALSLVNQGKVAQRCCQVGMLGPQGMLEDFRTPPLECRSLCQTLLL